MKLELWFEFASTYSHLTVQRIEGAAAELGVEIAWRPFLLGPIFAEQGWNDSPFNLYPAKGRYMWRDMERRAAAHGVAFRRPSVFPRSGLQAARAALVADREGWCGAFARAVYHANFAEDRDVSDPAVIRVIVEDLGHDGSAVLAAAGSDEIKAALRNQTDQARSLGIFGAPSFVVGDELFWGDDRMEEALARAGNAK